MILSQDLLYSFFALLTVVNGSPVEPQLDQRGLSAIVCAVVTAIVKEVKNDAKVTSHCSSFLKIPTSTVTRTGVTTSTALSTSTLTATIVVPVTTLLQQETTVTTTSTSTTIATQTLSQGVTTVTAPVITARTVTTSTVPLCPTPITSSTLEKRDDDGYVTADPMIWAEKRSLEARATKKSGVEIIKSLQSKVASTVCKCLSIPTATTTTTSLSTSRTTSWHTVTAFQSVSVTTTVTVPVTKFSTQVTTETSVTFTIVPSITITVPPAQPPATTTSTTTTTSTCTFTLTPTIRAVPFLARSAAKVHARGNSRGAPVRFSDEGSAFRLDTDGHLLDENQLVAVAEAIPSNGVAAVEFQRLQNAKNESMLVCGSGEMFLECNIGGRPNKLMVCLPKGEEHPAMYIAEESYDGDCFDGGFKVEVQEL